MPESSRKHGLRKILVIEDNPADLTLTLEALKHSGIDAEVYSVSDGQTALEFLRQRGVHSSAWRPDLVLLDGDLPRISGFDVLEAIKMDPAIRQIPVVMVSGNASDANMERAYDRQIAAYIVKPYSFDEYSAAIRAVEELWFNRAALPEQHPNWAR